MPHPDNKWQLYEHPGWQDCHARLDQALAEHLAEMDDLIVVGVESPSVAAAVAFGIVLAVLDREENSVFGAGDTEGRQYLADRLQRHVREKHCCLISVDSWGGVVAG